jgi:hypothetical protein
MASQKSKNNPTESKTNSELKKKSNSGKLDSQSQRDKTQSWIKKVKKDFQVN